MKHQQKLIQMLKKYLKLLLKNILKKEISKKRKTMMMLYQYQRVKMVKRMDVVDFDFSIQIKSLEEVFDN